MSKYITTEEALKTAGPWQRIRIQLHRHEDVIRASDGSDSDRCGEWLSRNEVYKEIAAYAAHVKTAELFE